MTTRPSTPPAPGPEGNGDAPSGGHDVFTTFVRAHGDSAESALLARLLKLGVRGPARPVDRLIERLSRPDSAAWLNDALREIAGSAGGSVEGTVLNGATHITALRSLKDRCKKAAAKGSPGEEPLAPMLGYFMALASAMAHHNALISSVPRSEIEGVLLDLACVLPDPWAELFCKATLVEMVVKA